MTERALSFGSVAAAYERFRPGYPDELVDAVLAYPGLAYPGLAYPGLAHPSRSVRTALEIGAGTGKATRAFARRGIAVTATDPDPAMLAELRRHVPASVVTVEAAFEDLAPGRLHDLVYAAAALHWTEPTGRWSRVVAQLVPGGTFASFGGQVHLADAGLDERVREVRAPYLDTDEIPSPDPDAGPGRLRWPGSELVADGRFTDVRESTIPRRLVLSASDYVGHLSTISAYLELSREDRQGVLEAILGVLPARVDVVADLTLHLARLRATTAHGESS